MKMYLDVKDSTDKIRKDLESEEQRRKLEVQLLEEKNVNLVQKVNELQAEKSERANEVTRLNTELNQR